MADRYKLANAIMQTILYLILSAAAITMLIGCIVAYKEGDRADTILAGILAVVFAASITLSIYTSS